MKTTKTFLSKKLFLFSFVAVLIFSYSTVFSQDNSQKKSWVVEYQKNNSFIENKGQFSLPDVDKKDIYFAIDHGSTVIYFTKKGVSYKFIKEKGEGKSEKEIEREEKEKFKSLKEYKEREEKEHKSRKYITDIVSMNWENPNSELELVGEMLTGDYHSYNIRKSNGSLENINYIKGYKKITYKNLYPHIDIEYSFTDKAGLKYAIIVNPGANPSDIKMLYNKNVLLKNSGDVHIDSKMGDIIDHAPITFYSDHRAEIISSQFIKNGKSVSFELGTYDKTKTIIIDPWTQTPAFTSNWDCVWECEKDGAGNVYIIGGVNPMQLLKYNSAGTLQWTYNTPYDTSAWLGTFATDLAGNSYVTQGSTAAIQKVSTSGSMVWNKTTSGSDEYWNIAFNCDQSKLIVAGTTSSGLLNLRGGIFDINTSNGNVNSVQVVAYGAMTAIPPSIQEVRAITSCGNGKYYFLTLDTIGFINQNFSLCTNGTSLYKTNSTYKLAYKSENYRRDNTGIMAIRADKNFVYTLNGTTLHKRSLSNGAIIASVAIPGGGSSASLGQNQIQNAGIDIDDCGNIYVGSKNQVLKFNSSLVQQASVAISFNAYDVHVSTNGDVIVAGSTGTSSSGSRTGYIQLISSFAACNTLSLTCCDATICQPPTKCVTDAPFQLQTATAGGTWSGSGVNASGQFNPATAGVGTHTVVYTLPCGSETITINVSACTPLSVCNNGSGFTVSGGTGPYDWQSGATSSGGGYSWTTYATNTVSVGTPTSYPIQVIDAAGGTFSISSAASVPNCTNSACPTLTVSVTSQTNVSCFGGNNGAATMNTAGGTGPYTYTWMPGNLSGASQTSLTAGTYTINTKDANGCTGSGTLTITQPTAALAVSITATTGATCGQNNGGATASATGGTPSYTYNWAPSGGSGASATNLSAGNYTVTVTDSKNCTTNTPVIINSTGGPTLSVTSQTNVSCFGGNNGAAIVSSTGGTGPYTYTWVPGNLSGSTQNSLTAGVYTISTKDAGGCIGSGTLSITQPTAALSAVANGSATTCGGSTGSATVSASGGTPSYTYSWAPGGGTGTTISGLNSGNYSVLVTDANSCTVTAAVTINSAGGPTVSISSQTNISCSGGNTGAATVSATGGSGSYTYTWSPSGGNSASASGLAAGAYTVSVSDGSCTSYTTVTITQASGVTLTLSSTPANCTASDGTATVTAIGGSGNYTYTWSPSGGSSSVASGLAPGNYTVMVDDGTGCTASGTVTVNSINTGFSVDAGTSVWIQSGSSTILNGTAPSGSSYTWTPSSSLDNPNSLNPVASPNQTTTYTLTVTNSSGCVSFDTVTVHIELPCGELFVPTAFSPNGDNQNDVLFVYGNCVTDLTFAIYDRWGEKVFETTTVATGWDGTFRGKALNPAVFAYYLKAVVDGKEVSQHGSITLVK